MQLYPDSTEYVPDYLADKYEDKASTYWDKFYNRNGNKFFKDRHYFDREFPELLNGPCSILEVGCGVGNALFPLMQLNPQAKIHAFDFSSKAVQMLKQNPEFDPQKINAFVADLTRDELINQNQNFNIQKLSMDYVMMIFVLSAIKPVSMIDAIRNLRMVLKPGSGKIFFRDYYVGDLAQIRFEDKKQKLGENYFVRGDGTTTYFFEKEELINLFREAGLQCQSIEIIERQLQNHKKGLIMDRQWIQATFTIYNNTQNNYQQSTNLASANKSQIQSINNKLKNISIMDDSSVEKNMDVDQQNEWDQFMPSIFDNNSINSNINNCESMDGLDFVDFEDKQIKIGENTYQIRCVDRINQHTFQHTGLMLWEGSELLSRIINRVGASILQNRYVLELGSGLSPLCGLSAAKFCRKIILTDGNDAAIPLLKQNLRINSHLIVNERVKCCRLIWGNQTDIKKSLLQISKDIIGRRFGVILGADVMYAENQVQAFFYTCRQLMFSQQTSEEKIVFLCHVQRGVAQKFIDDMALKYGFQGQEVPGQVQNAFLMESGIQQQSYFCIKWYRLQY